MSHEKPVCIKTNSLLQLKTQLILILYDISYKTCQLVAILIFVSIEYQSRLLIYILKNGILLLIAYFHNLYVI